MRIEIEAEGVEVPDQLRAYIEYRMFPAASRLDGRGGPLTVVLRKRAGGPDAERCLCVATVDLAPDESVRVRASADHVNAAVDRAAERLLGAGVRRLAGEAAGPSPAAGRRSRGSTCARGKERGS